MRTFVLFLLFTSYAVAQESVREWQSDSGKIIEAEMIEFSDEEVTLRIDGGREVTVALDKLHEVDRNYVRLQETLAQDEKQFSAVAQHLEAIRTSPLATIDILKELGKIHPKSPYGHLWAGVALGITNEPEDALKLFESTQIDKDRIYNDVLDIETQIKKDKEEFKERFQPIGGKASCVAGRLIHAIAHAGFESHRI